MGLTNTYVGVTNTNVGDHKSYVGLNNCSNVDQCASYVLWVYIVWHCIKKTKAFLSDMGLKCSLRPVFSVKYVR